MLEQLADKIHKILLLWKEIGARSIEIKIKHL